MFIIMKLGIKDIILWTLWIYLLRKHPLNCLFVLSWFGRSRCSIYSHLYRGMHVYVNVSGCNGKRLMSNVFFNHSPLYFWSTLSLIWLANELWVSAHLSFSSLGVAGMCVTVPDFYSGTRDPNSGTLVSSSDNLPTETSP